MLEAIKTSSSRRIFGQNGLNDHSSRSHHIFQVKVSGFDKLRKAQTSLLNIVDLAGSERFKNIIANAVKKLDLSKSFASHNSTKKIKETAK
jgi:Kinesin motor domain